MVEFNINTACKLAIASFWSLLFIGCNVSSNGDIKSSDLQIKDTLVDSNKFETRVKAIEFYEYNRTTAEPIFIKNGIFKYSKGHDIIEYSTYRNGTGNLRESHKLEFQDSLLIKKSVEHSNYKSYNNYEYNQFGDLIKETANLIKQPGKIDEKQQEFTKLFDYDNRNLISQILYGGVDTITHVYDASFKKLSMIYATPKRVTVTDYSYNSSGQIVLKRIYNKANPKKYSDIKITYESDTITKIVQVMKTNSLSLPEDYYTTLITIQYDRNGLLKKVIIDEKSNKRIITTSFSYDQHNNLIDKVTKEEGAYTTTYNKYSYGGYELLESFVLLPKSFFDFRIYNKTGFATTQILNRSFGEPEIEWSMTKYKKKIVEDLLYCPSYYANFKSKDGINWKPSTKREYKYEKVKQKM